MGIGWLWTCQILEETKYQIGLMDWKTKELKVLTDTIYKYQQSPVFVLAE